MKTKTTEKTNSEEKRNLYKEIDEKTKVLTHPNRVHETAAFWTSGAPKKLFDIWRRACYDLHGDIYWSKIWSDHLKAEAYDLLINTSVQKVEEKEEENENEISMIGDPYGGN